MILVKEDDQVTSISKLVPFSSNQDFTFLSPSFSVLLFPFSGSCFQVYIKPFCSTVILINLSFLNPAQGSCLRSVSHLTGLPKEAFHFEVKVLLLRFWKSIIKRSAVQFPIAACQDPWDTHHPAYQSLLSFFALPLQILMYYIYFLVLQ